MALEVSRLGQCGTRRAVELAAINGHLVAKSAKPIGVVERDVLSRAEALLASF